ncbi:hypothetical protein GGS20DRAFT_583516 [Poronia punctata]|nr:hypothetical protein GGS20DRAFT_583516 [Poronia punctata]
MENPTTFPVADLLDDERPMYEILMATLRYEADTDLKAAKLADDIKFFFRVENRKNGGCDLMELWSLVLEMAQHIPSDHPWQDSLAQGLHLVRHEKSVLPGCDPAVWEDLPYLDLRMRELWNEDPSDGNIEEEIRKGEFSEWKNLNSFAARFTNPSYLSFILLGHWQIRLGLESTPTKGAAQECRLWVACEWFLRSAEIIYQEYVCTVEDPSPAYSTGPLCDEDIPQFGPARWNFWKKRLAELSAQAEELKLGSSIVERMSKAIEKMEAVERA